LAKSPQDRFHSAKELFDYAEEQISNTKPKVEIIEKEVIVEKEVKVVDEKSATIIAQLQQQLKALQDEVAEQKSNQTKHKQTENSNISQSSKTPQVFLKKNIEIPQKDTTNSSNTSRESSNLTTITAGKEKTESKNRPKHQKSKPTRNPKNSTTRDRHSIATATRSSIASNNEVYNKIFPPRIVYFIAIISIVMAITLSIVDKTSNNFSHLAIQYSIVALNIGAMIVVCRMLYSIKGLSRAAIAIVGYLALYSMKCGTLIHYDKNIIRWTANLHAGYSSWEANAIELASVVDSTACLLLINAILASLVLFFIFGVLADSPTRGGGWFMWISLGFGAASFYRLIDGVANYINPEYLLIEDNTLWYTAHIEDVLIILILLCGMIYYNSESQVNQRMINANSSWKACIVGSIIAAVLGLIIGMFV
jgi:hypothetical protein